MFKVAATKIAHNTTIPSLAGNRDLRPLQDLITAEKAVLTSLQRLGTDFAKAAEALRIWGTGEGEDLGDILSASTTILTLYSTALSQYATLGHTMREQLKSVRAREENLDDLKRRRKALGTRADTAEKKLNKMTSEHRNHQVQVETLNALRAEIRSMDSEIMSEEAYLGDFKRTITKSWVGLKFGGLLECCEKGTIVGEYGKLIISEIPEEQTQPGTARSLYYGRPKIEGLLTEVHRCINDVVMSTDPLSGPPRITQQSRPSQSSYQNISTEQRASSTAATEWSPHDPTPADGGLPNYLPSTQGLGTGQFLEPPRYPDDPNYRPYSPQTSHLSQVQTDGAPYRRSLDDFGIPVSNISGPIDSAGPGSGGRFATFPTKARSSVSHTLTNNTWNSGNDDSFSASVSEAWRSSQSPPAAVPGFNAVGYDRPEVHLSAASQAPPLFAPPLGPPPGRQVPVDHRDVLEREAIGEDETLAYLGDSQEPQDRRDFHHDNAPSRHVRFGGETYLDEEQPQFQTLQDQEDLQHHQDLTPLPRHEDSFDSVGPSLEAPLPSSSHTTVESAYGSQTQFQNQHRVPVPSFDPVLDERALNAAAAREVSREMESLSYNSQVGSIRDDHSSREASPNGGRARAPVPQFGDPGRVTPPSNQIDNPLTALPRRGPSPYHSPAQSLSHAPPLMRPSREQSPQPEQRSLNPHDDRDLPPERELPRIVTAIPQTSLLEEPTRLLPHVPRSSSPSPYVGYPRSLGLGSSPVTKSTSSLNSLPQGARTISAAAFKRQAPRISSDLPVGETSPMSLKKRLPSSPYPQQRRASPSSSRSGSPRARNEVVLQAAPSPQVLLPVPASSADHDSIEEDYEYLSAYVESGSGASHSESVRGYGEGKYATNLENER